MVMAATRDNQIRPLAKIRETHHALARAIARGMSDVEASSVTGYSPLTVTRLRSSDPAFMELVAAYREQVSKEFAQVVDRMRTLGLSALDELQQRLEDDPAGWTKRELMEMSKLLLVDGPKAPGGGSGGMAPGAATVNIRFVQAAEVTPLIDITGEPS